MKDNSPGQLAGLLYRWLAVHMLTAGAISISSDTEGPNASTAGT
jgi:hypothetical protein